MKDHAFEESEERGKPERLERGALARMYTLSVFLYCQEFAREAVQATNPILLVW